MKFYKFYYLTNDIDNSFQSIKLNNSTSSLGQISIYSTKTKLYNKINSPIGYIYYTFTLYSNRAVGSGTIELTNIGSFFYNFITNIQMINGIPVIPTGTIIKTTINSGSGKFLNKQGYILISYLQDRRNFEITILN